MDNEKEISFGAFYSELMRQKIFIPEGFEATIDGNKIILTRIESEDEKIRKRIIHALHGDILDMEETNKALAWLEKQGEISPILSNSSNIGKNAWSEEDTIKIHNLITIVKCGGSIKTDLRDEYEDWLKSLKQRIKE